MQKKNTDEIFFPLLINYKFCFEKQLLFSSVDFFSLHNLSWFFVSFCVEKETVNSQNRGKMRYGWLNDNLMCSTQRSTKD